MATVVSQHVRHSGPNNGTEKPKNLYTACSVDVSKVDDILDGKYAIVYGFAESVADAKFVRTLKKPSIFSANLAACVVDNR